MMYSRKILQVQLNQYIPGRSSVRVIKQSVRLWVFSVEVKVNILQKIESSVKINLLWITYIHN